VDPGEWHVPPHCVPIHANVVTFNWSALISAAQFDAIVMDPPWQLATANPTRGVALGYSQLCDQDIANLPIPQVGTRVVDGLAGPLYDRLAHWRLLVHARSIGMTQSGIQWFMSCL
jgi:hypothetical protein